MVADPDQLGRIPPGDEQAHRHHFRAPRLAQLPTPARPQAGEELHRLARAGVAFPVGPDRPRLGAGEGRGGDLPLEAAGDHQERALAATCGSSGRCVLARSAR